MAKTSAPLANLRAATILVVVAFHSSLPYLASQSAAPYRFDMAPYRWIAFPILDSARWSGFDLFCAWQDVGLMSLMFLLAGLFTPAGLRRRGAAVYMRDRLRRIGVPFVIMAAVLSPLAYYASFRQSMPQPTLASFGEAWLDLPMWPSGPAWFLWQLLVLCGLAAAAQALAPRLLSRAETFGVRASLRPGRSVAVLLALAIAAYVPLALIYTPWRWAFLGPFSFQPSRALHYALFFFVGFVLGAHGYDRGILRADGPLALRWRSWLGAAAVSFAAWGGLTALTWPDWEASPVAYRVMAAIAFPIASATYSFCLIAMALRWLRFRDARVDSLSSSAYSIYFVHYVIVVWLGFALLAAPIGAAPKAALVFAVALACSWTLSGGFAMLTRRRSRGAPAAAVAHQPQ